MFEDDKIQATWLAADRVGSYEEHKTLNTRRGDLSDTEAHYFGALAEECIGRVAGAATDVAVYEFGDDGTDLTIRGNAYDVKLIVTDLSGPDTPDPHLLVEQGEVHAERYLLANHTKTRHGEFIEVLGYATRREVLETTPKQWPVDIENHAVPHTELHPITF
ncbi:MAG: hypothetical protein ABEJ94_06810 [Halorientalis sp.]